MGTDYAVKGFDISTSVEGKVICPSLTLRASAPMTLSLSMLI